MQSLNCIFWKHLQVKDFNQNIWLFTLVDLESRVLQGFVREVKPFWSELLRNHSDNLLRLEMDSTWSSKTKECRLPIINRALGVDVSLRSILIHLANTKSKTVTIANSENCLCVVYINPTQPETENLITLAENMTHNSGRMEVPGLATNYLDLVKGFPAVTWELIVKEEL